MDELAMHVTLGCEGCQREQTIAAKVALRQIQLSPNCQYCGQPLSVPPLLLAMHQSSPKRRGAPMRTLADCPVCLRPSRAEGHRGEWLRGRCLHCRSEFECDESGNSRFGLPEHADPEDAWSVDAAFSDVPPSLWTDFMIGALRARAAAGQVATGESQLLAQHLTQILSWSQQAPDGRRIPLDPELVAELAAHHCFDVAGTPRSSGSYPVLLFLSCIGSKVDAGQLAASIGENVVGHMSAELLGVGWSRSIDLEPRLQETSLELHCKPVGEHCVLQLQRGPNCKVQTPVGRAEIPNICRQLYSDRDAIAAYLCRNALFGPAVAALPMRMTEVRAWARRVTQLGDDARSLGPTVVRLASYELTRTALPFA